MDKLPWMIRVPVNFCLSLFVVALLSAICVAFISWLYSLGWVYTVVGVLSTVIAVIYVCVYETCLSEDRAKKKKRIA